MSLKRSSHAEEVGEEAEAYRGAERGQWAGAHSLQSKAVGMVMAEAEISFVARVRATDARSH